MICCLAKILTPRRMYYMIEYNQPKLFCLGDDSLLVNFNNKSFTIKRPCLTDVRITQNINRDNDERLCGVPIELSYFMNTDLSLDFKAFGVLIEDGEMTVAKYLSKNTETEQMLKAMYEKEFGVEND